VRRNRSANGERNGRAKLNRQQVEVIRQRRVDLLAVEQDKIKGAIRTDFVLSAEIIVITLGIVADVAFGTQVAVLAGIAVVMTIGVYGLVAGIVKLDDLGLYLTQRASAAKQAIGRGILYAAPWLMKFLSVAGTAAMFLVGGGILVHGIGPLHHWVQETMPRLGGWALPAELGINAGVGIAAGCVLVALWMGVQKLRGGAAH
jgi:predicted DNA repair protein MutK